MTRLPTTAAVGHLVDSCRALTRKPRDKRLPDLTLADSIERRLAAAVNRDRSGSVVPDGFPAGTLGGGGGQRGNASTVEAAVLALAQGVAGRDRHHELTVLAVQSLEATVENAQRCLSALASLDDLVSDTVAPTVRTCSHCTGKRGPDSDRSVYATGTVGDRLERSIALCDACYGFVTQTAPAGSHTGYLPSEQQIADHEQRGRWRIRMTTTTGAA